MFEWMHDKNVTEYLNTDFSSKGLSDCEDFIRESQSDDKCVHLAITNDDNEYMGTVSLKHIQGTAAEFGIAIRTVAMGKGYSKAAMYEILNRAFNEYNLSSVYWCVNANNQRALRFYDHNGYKRISPKHLNLGGGIPKNRFNSLFGIKPQETRWGTVSKHLYPDTKGKYYFLLSKKEGRKIG